MKPEESLPYSQQPATVPYPESDEPSPYTPTLFFKTHSNVILSSITRSSKWALLRFTVKNLHAFLIYPMPPPILFSLIWSP